MVREDVSRNSASSIALIFFNLYIVMSILLPGGSAYGINVKIIVFLPLTFFAARILAHEPKAILQFAFAALVASVVIAWMVWSLSNPFFSDLAPSQTKDVLTTLAGCLFVRLFTTTEFDRRKFVRLCLYTVTFGSLLKLLILIYALRTGSSITAILDRVSVVFGVKLMTLDVEDLGGRLQFPSDNLLPICIFVIIGLRRQLHFKWISAVMINALFLFSSLYTFSRFTWLSTLIAIVLGILVSRWDKLVILYLTIIASVTAYYFKVITTVIALRFSSPLAAASDIDRVQQIPALKHFFWNAPLLGNGLGSYTLQLKRSGDVAYSYEVQILALLGQLGIIGIGLLLLLLVNYYRKAFHFERTAILIQLSILILLLNFLVSGFFNPALLISMSAVSYGLIFVLAAMDFSQKISSPYQPNQS